MNPTAEDMSDIDRMILEEGKGDGKKKENMTDRLIKLTMQGAKLFHDSDGTGYIAISKTGEGETILPVIGTELKARMSRGYFKIYRRGASDKAIKETIGVLNGVAIVDGDEIPLANRVTWRDGNIVYDMSNPQREEVKIGKEGWRIHNATIPSFKRYPHQSAQTRPESGGDINDIFKIINVVEEDRLLTLVHIISSFVPDIPHPMIVLGGEQGSAKSSASKILKALIDPSVIDTVAMPRNDERMHQILSKHWYLIFDNVSWIQDWQSDLFCRAVTGQADVTREYFTTSDDHIFSYKMCLGVNGITSLVTRPDLLDRSLMIRLLPITRTSRMSEEEVNTIFERMRGEILGAIFEILGKAIEIHKTVVIRETPRMADFAKWGCAISEALGYTQDAFMGAYDAKIESGNMDAIDATPVAGLIIDLMATREEWLGTPDDLYNALRSIIYDKEMRKEDFLGMKSPKSLGGTFERISPNLRKIGIDWSKPPRTSQKRLYKIVKHPNNGCSMTFEDVHDVCASNVIVCENNRVGNTIGAQTSQTNQTSQPSKPIDLDQSTIDRIRKATSEAMAKSNNSDGCDIDQITFAVRGLARTTVAKCVLLNPGGAWEPGERKGLYRLRTELNTTEQGDDQYEHNQGN